MRLPPGSFLLKVMVRPSASETVIGLYVNVVCNAENGRLGVDIFAGSPAGTFSAILMDLRMPVLDGLAATKEIRSLGRADSKTIPIIAMTADAFEDDVQKCLAAGLNDHIAKPVEPKVLFATLAKYLK